MTMGRGVTLIGVLFALAVAAAPTPAQAFDHELQLGADLFYSKQFTDAGNFHGGGAGARLRYGFTDAIAIAAKAAWAGHSVINEDEEEEEEEESAFRQIVTGAVGVHYAVDVFFLVPYLSVLTGVLASFEDGGTQPFFLLDVGGGMDWMVTSSFSIGVSATYQLAVGATVIPARLCVSLRLSWHRRLRTESS